eukprot:2683268-Pyramimonas_sp.AAC.1
MPRVEENPAASPSTQPPAKLGGIDTAGSPPKVWRPSIRDPPANLTQLIGLKVADPLPMDQSHQKAEPRVKAAPKWARRRGGPQHAEGSAAGGQPAKAQNL